jgi:hypothetical protein
LTYFAFTLQRVHPNINQDSTYLANNRNGPANAAMVSPDFSTPVVAQSLAQTDNIVLAIDVQDSSNLTTGLAYANQEKQHLVRKI